MFPTRAPVHEDVIDTVSRFRGDVRAKDVDERVSRLCLVRERLGSPRVSEQRRRLLRGAVRAARGETAFGMPHQHAMCAHVTHAVVAPVRHQRGESLGPGPALLNAFAKRGDGFEDAGHDDGSSSAGVHLTPSGED